MLIQKTGINCQFQGLFNTKTGINCQVQSLVNTQTGINCQFQGLCNPRPVSPLDSAGEVRSDITVRCLVRISNPETLLLGSEALLAELPSAPTKKQNYLSPRLRYNTTRRWIEGDKKGIRVNSKSSRQRKMRHATNL